MSILWQDGFDLYGATADLSMNYISPNRGTILTSGGRFSGGAFEIEGGQPTISVPLSTSETEVWVSYGLSFYTLVNLDAIVAVFGSSSTTVGGVECCVTYNQATGVFKVWNGYLSTLLGSVTTLVSSGWHWIDVRCALSATVGAVEIWLDDSQLLVLTGQNTIKNAGVSTLAYVGPSDPYAGAAASMTIDDLFVTDSSTGRLGDSRIETIVPTSDATPNDGTPSTGSNHWACVDEAQWNTTDYITMPNTSGDKEVYGCGSIVSTPAVVHAVKVYMVSQKSDAGSFQLEPLVVSSGTESDGAAVQLLTTSWGVQSAMFEQNPHTSAAWTYAATNAMDIGYKVP